MKILFIMRHQQYIRIYKRAIEDLMDKGHQFHFIFLNRNKNRKTKKDTPLDNGIFNIISEKYAPNIESSFITLRKDLWTDLANIIRVTLDFLRYLDPVYRKSPKYVNRGGRRVPLLIKKILTGYARNNRVAVSNTIKLLKFIESCIPTSTLIDNELKSIKPDIVLFSPIIDSGQLSIDYMKSSKKLGYKTVLCVASWDNLTTKGLNQIEPDKVLVWNNVQKEEAAQLHYIKPWRVMPTGAQLFDDWFEMEPSLNKEQFCAKINLNPSKPYVLYLCSSSFVVNNNEVDFIIEWINKIRTCNDELINSIGILIRPHPNGSKIWESVEINFDNVSVWPIPVTPPTSLETRNDFYNSLYHCSAAVGINTSTMIEAGILNKPILTLIANDFRHTQTGSIHFHHLSKYGLLYVAETFEQHLHQLKSILNGDDKAKERRQEFIRFFVRPHGIGKPATPIFVREIENIKPYKNHHISFFNIRTQLFSLFLRPVARIVKKMEAGTNVLNVKKSPSKKYRKIKQGLYKKKRILFFMSHPGFLRYYFNTLDILLSKGNKVRMFFQLPTKQNRENLHIKLGKKYPKTFKYYDLHKRIDKWQPIITALAYGMDYARFLTSDFKHAKRLRERAELRLNNTFKSRIKSITRCTGNIIPRSFISICRYLYNNVVPPDDRMVKIIRKHNPDIVLVSPLISFGSSALSDALVAAHRLSVPTGYCVASWDNLTSKGIIRGNPDKVILWNAIQKREAIKYHKIDSNKIVMTGSQHYDEWFIRKPSCSKQDFIRKIGLGNTNHYFLYMCSSIQMAPYEKEFVKKWIENARKHPDPFISEAGILIRPYPEHYEFWSNSGVQNMTNVVVWPKTGEYPLTDETKNNFVNSICHSTAVIGVNTSSLIESAIYKKPVFTILDKTLKNSQIETIHFHYLKRSNGGFLFVAKNFDEHFCQLKDFSQKMDEVLEVIDNFVKRFVRPNGMDFDCQEILVREIEKLGTYRSEPHKPQLFDFVLRFILSKLPYNTGEFIIKQKKIYRELQSKTMLPRERGEDPVIVEK